VQCKVGERLLFAGVKVYRLEKGATKTFNLKTWVGVGGLPYKVSAVDNAGTPLTSVDNGGKIY
jgi:hypothetical protein